MDGHGVNFGSRTGPGKEVAEVAREDNCIFCKIIDKKLPASFVTEDDDMVVIRDIKPQAPTHLLVMPRSHVRNLGECEDAELLGRLFQTAARVARDQKLSSFRTVVNTGPQSGQSVFHLHIHVLGGRSLRWPPG